MRKNPNSPLSSSHIIWTFLTVILLPTSILTPGCKCGSSEKRPRKTRKAKKLHKSKPMKPRGNVVKLQGGATLTLPAGKLTARTLDVGTSVPV